MPNEITEKRLTQIEARAKAATLGPWWREMYEDGEDGEGPHGVHPCSPVPMLESNTVVSYARSEELELAFPWECAAISAAADAEFIAHARTDIPDLIAAVREARDWVRKLTRDTRVLTCAFCGEAYQPNTPESNHEALAAHIKVCARHPMRDAEALAARLLVEVRNLLASAVPHPIQHPTMNAAWVRANALLEQTAQAPQDQSGR